MNTFASLLALGYTRVPLYVELGATGLAMNSCRI